jgi:hypothetical protein
MTNKQYNCQNDVVLGPALYNYIYRKENAKTTFAVFFIFYFIFIFLPYISNEIKFIVIS